MVEQGYELVDGALRRARRLRKALEAVPGLRLMGPEIVEMGLAADLDLLKIVVDVRELGISGMRATEWLRTNCHVDMGASDTCRVSGVITHADDDRTEELFLDSLTRLVDAAGAGAVDGGRPVDLPEPGALELEQVMLPRTAFFGPAEQVPASQAVGRIAAEMISPYPPGVPAVAPGELVTAEVLDYLRSGAASGLLIPDAADPSMESVRVVAA
ncbi:hypothetical protein ACF08N_05280 [Streptomyces sp. NPDC015127]|uniref:Orn/Lys/Arg family decarboxylase n=1 Tax=Streptomyces sp. NPDC015127 TaxID=3364939 RepID=UPI0036FD6AF6